MINSNIHILTKIMFVFVIGLIFPLQILAQTQVELSEKDYPANPLAKKGWKLTAHDEFDGPELNESLWIPYYFRQRMKDDERAKYIFRDGCIVLQVYNDNVSSIQTMESNKLVSEGIREIPTKINFVQKYGYFEIRAKTQKGSGHNSAFWLLGNSADSTKTAEIDVLEQVGKYGNNVAMASLHTWKDRTIKPFSAKQKDFQKKFSSTDDLGATFNIYAVEWSPSYVRFYLNNVPYYTINRSPHYSMSVLLSLYQNPKTWLGDVDKNQPYPKEFAIDYFRAYKKVSK